MRNRAYLSNQNLNAAPPIEPVAEGTPRPRWSVMIPAFNCAVYLRETIESVLAQDPGPEQMQIEVIDDCSTKDNPESVVREIGRGRVDFYRQPVNVGVTENFNTCVRRSRGRLVHILHGDDYVLPGFYAKVERASERHPEVGAFFTRCFEVEEDGSLRSLTDRLGFLENPAKTPGSLLYSNSIRTPGVVLSRAAYEEAGGFLPSLVHCADWEMWVRSTSIATALSINEPLASYRFSPQNDSGKLTRTGENIRDTIKLGAIWRLRFSEFDENKLLKCCADQALNQAIRFRAIGDTEAYIANIIVWRHIVTLRDLAAFLIRGMWPSIRYLFD